MHSFLRQLVVITPQVREGMNEGAGLCGPPSVLAPPSAPPSLSFFLCSLIDPANVGRSSRACSYADRSGVRLCQALF